MSRFLEDPRLVQQSNDIILGIDHGTGDYTVTHTYSSGESATQVISNPMTIEELQEAIKKFGEAYPTAVMSYTPPAPAPPQIVHDAFTFQALKVRLPNPTFPISACLTFHFDSEEFNTRMSEPSTCKHGSLAATCEECASCQDWIVF